MPAGRKKMKKVSPPFEAGDRSRPTHAASRGCRQFSDIFGPRGPLDTMNQ
jgi:hypothetical protein